ncbi:hypothetical protein MSG28_011203 [Choristoneura fumiferana]|uniref:Uncharacterized protein n=1 Tax=Choristoneura fumiferana TaxID=7141 RepID=A0ACC0KRP9_CHOFU|nr:hypothetical protein MSG28_011203 [Choristoneura fumiferana]
MRYFKRLTFWKPNGPIYLFIGGDFEMFSGLIERYCLFPCQLANETNGALFASEHRYYGESMPVDIKDTSSMKYLSSKQALADLAALIKTIKSAPEFKSSKVVVIGGSYAGNLAAWMRLLYPDLVDAAVSSSAPLLAKKDFNEYLEARCNEFGNFETTNSDKQPFGHNVPLDFFIKQCQAIFGEDFNEKRVDDGVAQTNIMYGGITPNVTNVVFTHGDMDPWRRLGVLKDLSDTAVVRITNGTSNSALLNLDSSNPALLKDREYVKQMIKKWIEKA